MHASNERLEGACEEIREEYAQRSQRKPPRSSAAARASRNREYEVALRLVGLGSLHGMRILDAGCGHGGWLQRCCAQWGASPEDCFGVDIFPEGINQWERENPGTRITLRCAPSHQLPFDDASFDVVHQSMMFSSIVDADLRRRTAAELWRVLRPDGHLVWYDFWTNPFNRKTVPMRLSRVWELFPFGRIMYRKRITLAPPLSRLMSRVVDGLVPLVERLRILNTHHLLIMRKPTGCEDC